MTTNQAKQYFYDLHDVERNQKYGGDLKLPYSFHLKMVDEQIKRWLYLIPADAKAYPLNSFSDITLRDIAIVGGAGHDSLEGDGLSYSDLRKVFNDRVAEAIFRCTEFRGRTRKERHCAEFLQQLAEDEIAVFVKLCDMMANVKFSLLTNSSMFDTYKKEWPLFKSITYTEGNNLVTKVYAPMYEYIESLFSIKQ